MAITGAIRPVPSHDIDGLVLDCSISIALAMEILQSCTEPSIFPTSAGLRVYLFHLWAAQHVLSAPNVIQQLGVQMMTFKLHSALRICSVLLPLFIDNSILLSKYSCCPGYSRQYPICFTQNSCKNSAI